MMLIQVVKRRPSGLVTAQEVREDGSIQPRKNTLVIRFERPVGLLYCLEVFGRFQDRLNQSRSPETTSLSLRSAFSRVL